MPFHRVFDVHVYFYSCDGGFSSSSINFIYKIYVCSIGMRSMLAGHEGESCRLTPIQNICRQTSQRSPSCFSLFCGLRCWLRSFLLHVITGAGVDKWLEVW